MNKADAQKRAAEVLATLDLEEAADRSIGTYSGGMKRRLDVGLGIVHPPAVLFLDEPTTGLDPQARARMWDEIRRAPRAGDDRLPDDPLPRGGGRPARTGWRSSTTARSSPREPPTSSSGRSPATSSRIGVNGSTERVLETRPAPAVRARGDRRGRVRPALRGPRRDRRPAAPRGCSTAAGLEADLDRPQPSEPRRRLPPPDRSLAPRRSCRLIDASTKGTST